MKGFLRRNDQLLVDQDVIIAKTNVLNNQAKELRVKCKALNHEIINWLHDELLRETHIDYTVRRSFDEIYPLKDVAEFQLEISSVTGTFNVGKILLTKEQLDKAHLTKDELVGEFEKRRKQEQEELKEARYQEYLKLKEEFEK